MYTSTQAVAQAINATKDSRTWPDLCLSFVAHMYGLQASGTPDPKTAYNAWKVNPHKHPGDKNPPAGAPVYWEGRPGSAGHVAMSIGGGKVVSTHGNNGHPEIYNLSDIHISNYKGWTDPSFGASGFTVPKDFGTTTTTTTAATVAAPQKIPTTGGLNNTGQGTKAQVSQSLWDQVLGTATSLSPWGAIFGSANNTLDTVKAIFSKFLWITLPGNWVRIQAGIAGAVLIVLAIILFAWEGTSSG